MEGWPEYHPTQYIGPEDRIVTRVVRGERNKLLDFALIHETLTEDGWQEVKKYDSTHDTVHSHSYRRSGKPPKMKDVCDLDRIDEGYQVALDDLWDNWEKNKRGFMSG